MSRRLATRLRAQTVESCSCCRAFINFSSAGLRELLTSRELCDVALVAEGQRDGKQTYRQGKWAMLSCLSRACVDAFACRRGGFPGSPHGTQPQFWKFATSGSCGSGHLIAASMTGAGCVQPGSSRTSLQAPCGVAAGCARHRAACAACRPGVAACYMKSPRKSLQPRKAQPAGPQADGLPVIALDVKHCEAPSHFSEQ